MSLVVGECVFVNCGMKADPRRHEVMIRYIAGKLWGFGIPVIPDGEIVKNYNAVFVRRTGDKLVFVRVVQCEHNAAQKFTVAVLLRELDAASGGLVGVA